LTSTSPQCPGIIPISRPSPPRRSADLSEIEESAIRASGPGGQHVNKTASAVQLRFDARRSPSLPNDVAIRLMKLAGSRLTQDGVDRKSTRLNSSHVKISYAVFCFKKIS